MILKLIQFQILFGRKLSIEMRNLCFRIFFERVIVKFILLSERNVNNYLQNGTLRLWNFYDLSYL